MLYKNPFNSALVILICCLISLFSNTLIQAQLVPKEKPKIKNFGSSLKPKKEKNKGNSGTNLEKSKKADEGTDDVIRIETRLVRTDVLVVDQRGKAILGLKASDFIVTENNIPQEIETFSLGENVDVPKSIVLIIDYSGSQLPFIKNSVTAAKVLVDKLNPKDRMAIVTDDVELLTAFTNDKKLLKKTLDYLVEKSEYYEGQTQLEGKSLQYSALMATLGEMFDEEDIRPIIIFQTDGDQVFHIPTSGSANNRPKTKYTTNFTVNDLFNRIEKSRATIYSVIPGKPWLKLSLKENIEVTLNNMKNYYGRDLTKKEEGFFKGYTQMFFNMQRSVMIAARASGGFTESLETPEQADGIYTRILNDINNRYLIGYYPENLVRDGKRRNVKIEIRDHPEYIVWGRKTYLAPEPEK